MTIKVIIQVLLLLLCVSSLSFFILYDYYSVSEFTEEEDRDDKLYLDNLSNNMMNISIDSNADNDDFNNDDKHDHDDSNYHKGHDKNVHTSIYKNGILSTTSTTIATNTPTTISTTINNDNINSYSKSSNTIIKASSSLSSSPSSTTITNTIQQNTESLSTNQRYDDILSSTFILYLSRL